MHRPISALTAVVVAVMIGLLVANVASAARAAQNEASQAQAGAQRSANATDAELAAYKQRLDEALRQLQTTYQVLQSRDAAYAALVGDNAQAGAQADPVAVAAPSAATTPVNTAAGNAGQAFAPVALTAPSSAAGVAPPASQTVRTPTGLYCWYDHENHYVCEDHPQGR